MLRLVVTAAAAVVAWELLRRRYLRRTTSSTSSSSRVIVAVSGTIQDGFELRKNIDYRSECEIVRAVLLGYGVARGAKMYLDVKDESCREYDPSLPARVNPAMVLTGDANDANCYALYLVDERACLNALLGEPRLLTMTPDSLRIDLDDPETSPAVRAFARAVISRDGKTETRYAAVLAVVACYRSGCFVAAPPVEVRPDGTRLTSFRSSLAKFASIGSGGEPGTPAWNDAVAAALTAARAQQAKGAPTSPVLPTHQAADSLYATDSHTARISRRMTAAEFDAIAAEAGLGLRAGRRTPH